MSALEVALAREVPLAGGGRLLIEPTAAFVAIDVDGGGRAPLDIDLAAAAEIARQVRLRNLGGTIIVDFVDLPSRPERQRLEEALRKAFKHDPAPLEIHQMSSLGIVPLSRARRGQPLASRFLADCAGAAAAAASRRRGLPPSGCWRRCMVRVAWSARAARAAGEGDLLLASSAWRQLVQRSACSRSWWPTAALAAGELVLEEVRHGR